MRNYWIVALVLSGAMFSLACYLLLLWSKSRDRRRDLSLGLLLFVMGLYDIFVSRVHSSEGFSGAIPWLRLVSATDEVVAALALWYLAEYTSLVPRRVLAFAVSFFCLFAAAEVALPGELAWLKSGPDTFAVKLPFLPEASFKAFSLGPLGVAAIVSNLPFVAYCLVILKRFSGTGRRHDAWRIGLAVFGVALAVSNDALVSMGAYRFVYLTEYAWTGVLICSAYLSSHEISASAEAIKHLAFFDSLTGLPNRAMFQTSLASAISRSHRFGLRTALLFIDLDRFKEVNDILGHDKGDLVLVEVGKIIKARVRESDIVSRLGGDEFTVILEGLSRSEDAGIVAKSLIDDLSRPFNIEGVEFFNGASIGIAIYPYDDFSAEGLTRKADAAMYRAKGDGGNGYRFISGDTETKNRARNELEAEVRRAIENGDFILHFQPLVSIASRRVTGAEALIRLKRLRKNDLVSPADFIGLAEETGLIMPIGEWALNAACAAAADWERQGSDLSVSVNFSPHQFRGDTFVRKIERALEANNLSPRKLVLELTESALMTDISFTQRVLRDLKSLGVGIAIDDFGTGYSSLNHFARFPINELKIDQSFIHGIVREESMRTIVKAIIAMTASLGIECIAEGIEAEEEHSILSDFGCDTGQGFLYSKPCDSKSLLEFAG